ncbi:MAG: hypothetical protein LBG60_01360 [Bifidobacteriaceae bacterium]|nr:hypothetical protein [Bifidobacteriaceae bacterium]
MHFTLERAGRRQDYWAEDGSTLAQVLSELGLPVGRGVDRRLHHGALVRLGGADGPGPGGRAEGVDAAAGDDAAAVGLPTVVDDAPAADAADAVRPGGWRLVRLGSPDAGSSAPLRSASAPIRAGATRRGKVALSRAEGGGPVWWGRVRQSRGRLAVAWRRLRRGRRCSSGTLVTDGRAGLWALIREPVGAATGPDKSKRNWMAVGSTAATGLITAAVMLMMTGNPLWAAMPLAGVVAAALPMLLRRGRREWWEGVIGLDPAAACPVAPPVELFGPPAAVAALARRLITAWLAPLGRLPPVSAPLEPAWSWSRFAPRPPPGGLALTIRQVGSGLRLTMDPAWPIPAGGDSAADPAPSRALPSAPMKLPRGSDLTAGPARPGPQGRPVAGGQARLTAATAGAADAVRGAGTVEAAGTVGATGAAGAAGLVPPLDLSGVHGLAAGPESAGPDGLARWVVKDAGLGLVAARAAACEPFHAVGLGTAALERLSRRWAGVNPSAAPEDRVPLTAAEVAGNWREPAPRLPAIGRAGDGQAVRVDLASDGPHALVAGTSGSGKSEFLRALMLAECVAAAPDRLIIVGLDHKGGATFRDLEHLPHVVGVATDLDAVGTSRVLTSLEAELAGRERLLERHSAASWGELRADLRPARLLVVVDEFRTLLDALPQAAARLERLAAQGRSLGMGLVLATQRPAGAVSAQLRANLALRICFRVATEADSLDVLGTPEAARLDPASPGSCVLATAGRPPLRMRVRLMPPPPRRPARAVEWPGRWTPPPEPAPDPATLVKAIAGAAQAVGARPPAAPWRPPLPDLLPAARVGWPAGGGAVTIGLADQPDRQSQWPLTWQPSSGHLAILGPPRSGRTTAAVTVAAGLAAAGWDTHVVASRPEAFAALAALPRFGAAVPADQPERLGELLSQLGGGRTALVADAAAELESLAIPSLGRSVVDALNQGLLAPGAVLVITAPAKASRWLGACAHRLVLPTADPTDALALGLPKEMASSARLPGRACYLGADAPLMVQIALPPPPEALAARWPGPGPPAVEPPVKVLPLPSRVSAEDLPPSSADTVWIGLGGAYGAPLALPVRDGQPIAVVGPSGSGRSTALAGIQRRLDAAGRATQMFGAGAPRRWADVIGALKPGAVVLVDDLEAVTGPPPTAWPPHGTLVAALNTATASAFRPPAQLFHTNPLGLLLWPSHRGSAAAFGPGVRPGPSLDLAGGAVLEPPGRGRLICGAKTYPVQVAA